MSGPKRSNYSIGPSIADRLTIQRQQEQKRQQDEIRARIRDINKRVDVLSKSSNYIYTVHVLSMVGLWMPTHTTIEYDDPRIVSRSLTEIENFLSLQEDNLKQAKQREAERQRLAAQRRAEMEEQKRLQKEQKRLQEEKLRQEAELKAAFVQQKLKYFDDMRSEYPQLINAGIEQRMELYRNALSSNPENSDTLEKLAEMRKVCNKIIEDHLAEQDKKNYLVKTLKKIVGADEDQDGGDGGISGTLNGAPISVSFVPNSNEIIFNTPEDGSCKPQIGTLTKQLASAGIDLGPIRVVRTGEMLNRDSNEYSSPQRIRS